MYRGMLIEARNKRTKNMLTICCDLLFAIVAVAAILAVMGAFYYFERKDGFYPLHHIRFPSSALSSIYMDMASAHIVGLMSFVTLDLTCLLPVCYILWSVPNKVIRVEREDVPDVMEGWFVSLSLLLLLVFVARTAGIAALHALTARVGTSSVPSIAAGTSLWLGLFGGLVCAMMAWLIKNAA